MKKSFMAALAAASLLATACTRTIYLPVETERIKTDSIRLVSQRADTVRLSDTLLIFQKGDTLLRESIHWRERVRVKTDTIIRLRTDTVSIMRTVYQPENAKKTDNDSSIRIALVAIAIIAGIGAIALLIIGLLRKFKTF